MANLIIQVLLKHLVVRGEMIENDSAVSVQKGGHIIHRCAWAEKSDLEAKYHDEQWGVPIHDDRLLFEMLILEGAQAGLSWSTILQKRE